DRNPDRAAVERPARPIAQAGEQGKTRALVEHDSEFRASALHGKETEQQAQIAIGLFELVQESRRAPQEIAALPVVRNLEMQRALVPELLLDLVLAPPALEELSQIGAIGSERDRALQPLQAQRAARIARVLGHRRARE